MADGTAAPAGHGGVLPTLRCAFALERDTMDAVSRELREDGADEVLELPPVPWTHAHRPAAIQPLRGLSGCGVRIAAVSCGARHTIAVAAHPRGVLFAWGANDRGQLGLDGGHGDRHAVRVVAERVQALAAAGVRVAAVAAADLHSLVAAEDGTVYAMGANMSGQLGLNSTADVLGPPVRVEALVGTEVVALASGPVHTLFLARDGAVYSCGSNSCGQLGLGAPIGGNVLLPQRVLKRAHTRWAVLCGVDAHGDTRHFFVDRNAEHASENIAQRMHFGAWQPDFVTVDKLPPIAAVAVGSQHSVLVARRDAGSLAFAMGSNSSCALGAPLGEIVGAHTPRVIPLRGAWDAHLHTRVAARITAAAAGCNGTCLMDDVGRVYRNDLSNSGMSLLCDGAAALAPSYILRYIIINRDGGARLLTRALTLAKCDRIAPITTARGMVVAAAAVGGCGAVLLARRRRWCPRTHHHFSASVRRAIVALYALARHGRGAPAVLNCDLLELICEYIAQRA